mmetsp:Transcript_25895/g.38364  ORF Transcript_25895/g.38364 Transcript_25895/m.38364 type:complete len:440 (+) Transcript_25895:75-1394(+)
MPELSENTKLTSDDFFAQTDVSIGEPSSSSSAQSDTSISLGNAPLNGPSNGNLKENVLNKYGSVSYIIESDSDPGTLDGTTLSSETSNTKASSLRRLAIDLSLYLNLLILFSKLFAYFQTLSLSVLAALTDSLLDVISQLVLNYTEKKSTKSRSSAFYPAGAARLEPVGVLTCAALMGMASFEILKESIESLAFDGNVMHEHLQNGQNITAVYGMAFIVFVKLGLYFLCEHSRQKKASNYNSVYNSNSAVKQSVKVSDPTLEALAQDHWNDSLSNAVAAVALFAALFSEDLWFLDPIGAIIISLYIIYSWYETGKEQIEQLTGKSAPQDLIDELYDIASTFDKNMVVDVVRAYHFGPKFLVELEVVLPKDTLLLESHDLGMELQYEIEGREEVERCFVHIDYEIRPYDEHVVSKVPELRAKYRPSASASNISLYGNHSV